MRILFCADTFPGRFGALAASLAADGHEVLFASHYGRRDFSIPGVQRVLFKPVRTPHADRTVPGEAARAEWSRTLLASHYASDAFAAMRKNGFIPDMVVFSGSSGAALHLSSAFPESVLLGFADALSARASREAEEAAQLRQRACLAQSHACFAFSEQHLRGIPPLLRREACLLPLAVDTDFFSPERAQPFVLEGKDLKGKKLVTVDLYSTAAAASRELWNLCAGMLAHREEVHLLLSCGSPEAGEAAASVAKGLPGVWQSRLVVQEFKSLHTWRDMLCASALHLCPEAIAGAAPLPEIMEAMSCGAVLALPEAAARVLDGFLSRLASPDSGEMPEEGLSSYLLPLPSSSTEERLAALCRIIDDSPLRAQLKKKARRIIIHACSEALAAPRQKACLLEAWHRWKHLG